MFVVTVSVEQVNSVLKTVPVAVMEPVMRMKTFILVQETVRHVAMEFAV